MTVKKKSILASSNKASGKTDNNQSDPEKKVIRKRTPAKKASVRGKNGGARSGSGRKKGAATKKTRDIADKLAESDELTPLEYMLEVLRETPEQLKARYENGDIDQDEYQVGLKSMVDRRDWAAEKAAPYIHPRLSSIDARVTANIHEDWLDKMENVDADS